MSDTLKPSSWADLKDLEAVATKVINLPKTSEALGEQFNVKVRAITPLEVCDCMDFPLDEINRIREADGDDGVKQATTERYESMDIVQQLEFSRKVIEIGLVSPKASEDDIDRLQRDFGLIVNEIVSLSKPGDPEAAARFREDGSSDSD